MLSSGYGSLPSGPRFLMGQSPRKLLTLLLACAIPFAAVACGGEDTKTPEDVPSDAIALVGDTPIPRAEFESLMKRAEANYKAQNRPFPKAGTPEYQDLKNRAVEYLVDRYRFRAEAAELEVEVTDQEVDAELEKIRKDAFAGDDTKLREALKQQGLTYEEAREEIRERLLRDKVYKRVTDEVQVSDEEVRAFYDENKAQFTQPATRDVRHILVKTKSRADEVYALLQQGGNFAQLARQYSTDTATKKNGGKLPVTRGSTVPPFDKVAFDLPAGQFSRPVKTTYGWHIIKADGPVKDEQVTPFADVEDSIRDQVLNQKKQDALRDWIERLERKYEPEIVFATGFRPPESDTATDTGVRTDADTTTEQ
jgi:parvulin-like peptidyl-prolyl isomerase